MKEEKRVSPFVNMVVNSSVIIGTLMTEAMTGAVGEVAVGMTEGMANALDNTGSAKQKGAEMRQEVSKNVSSMVREMVESELPETRKHFEAIIGKMTPGQRKDLLADIGDESYIRAFDAIRKHDFGLPRLTERLSVDDVLGYIEIAKKEDPRFKEVMELFKNVKEPRLFAEMKEAAGAAEIEKEEAAPGTKAGPVPPTIAKLPATHLFPPGAEATISLKGKKELKLTWEADPGPGRSFDDYGISVSQGTTTTKTPYGGMTLYPENGKITATMKNLEAFPVTVEISAEK